MKNFEWDEENNLSNIKSYRISFLEAETVFCDPLIMTCIDIYDYNKMNYISLGNSSEGRQLKVIWTPCGEKVRLISVWEINNPANKEFEENYIRYNDWDFNDALSLLEIPFLQSFQKHQLDEYVVILKPTIFKLLKEKSAATGKDYHCLANEILYNYLTTH